MIRIRPGQRQDAAAIADFQVRMADETEGIALHRPTVEQGVLAVFDDARKGAYWIAELDGERAGCLLTVPEWSDWRNGTVLWVHSVYVVPAVRRLGVFRKMYETLKTTVDTSPDLHGIRLYVATENTGAQKTYRVMGMDDGRYHLFEWMSSGR
jgi:GNAT superfamily N-acetyltransferase